VPSKKKQDKIERLKDLYDLKDPKDLFTILPQEMELMEAMAMAQGLDGTAKKKAVMDVILDIAKVNNVELNRDIISVFIDIINDASKGKYALNKDQS
jgi:hypothetical protein